MRPDEMRRIARYAASGFAMPVTAQTEDEELTLMGAPIGKESDLGPDWSRRMLQTLGTPEQGAKVNEMRDKFPTAMDFSLPDGAPDILGMFGQALKDGQELERRSRGELLDQAISEADAAQQPPVEDELTPEQESNDELTGLTGEEPPPAEEDPLEGLASNIPTFLRTAGHLDVIGEAEAADELERQSMAELEALLEMLPDIVASDDDQKVTLAEGARCDQCKKKMNPVDAAMGKVCGDCTRKNHEKVTGKHKKASIRIAQALQDAGIDLDDTPEEQGSEVVAFDPERNSMIIQSPDGLYKMYQITGVGENGKPRFEFIKVIDSPDDRVHQYTDQLMGGDPSLKDYGVQNPEPTRLPGYMAELMQGQNPDLASIYAEANKAMMRMAQWDGSPLNEVPGAGMVENEGADLGPCTVPGCTDPVGGTLAHPETGQELPFCVKHLMERLDKFYGGLGDNRDAEDIPSASEAEDVAV